MSKHAHSPTAMIARPFDLAAKPSPLQCYIRCLGEPNPLSLCRLPTYACSPTKRTASLRHLTARQYRRITAHEAFKSSDARDEDEATDQPPLHPSKASTPCTQNALDGRRPGPHAGGAVAGGGGGKGPGRVWAFSVSGVRLVPKANGVRAIANLSKRVWADRDCVQWVEGVPLPVRWWFLFFFVGNSSGFSIPLFD